MSFCLKAFCQVIYYAVKLSFLQTANRTHLLYFIVYSAHFFKLKMMLKYSLCTHYTWKVAEKGFKDGVYNE
jgi:hypothetical protein